MLHELLLALLGYTRDLVIEEREQHKSLSITLSPDAPFSEECTFELAPDISFIEPSERNLTKKSNSLYTILRSSRLDGGQRAPFLRRFLLHLNFNSFFERHAEFCQTTPNSPSFALTRS